MATPGRTEPEDVLRILAHLPVGDEMRVEVFVCRRRRCFGRTDYFVEPARGTGGRWVRRENLEFIEEIPEQESRR